MSSGVAGQAGENDDLTTLSGITGRGMKRCELRKRFCLRSENEGGVAGSEGVEPLLEGVCGVHRPEDEEAVELDEPLRVCTRGGVGWSCASCVSSCDCISLACCRE